MDESQPHINEEAVSHLKQQFKEITCADDQAAQAMLEASNWCLETAIAHYTDIDQPEPSSSSIPMARQRRTHTHTQTQTQTHTQTHGSVNYNMPTFTHSLLSYILDSLRYIWGFAYKAAKFIGVLIFGIKPSRQSFSEMFESRFGLCHPNFFEGRFGEALGAARRRKVPVAVYVHSDAARDTRQFCSDLLSNSTIVEYMNSNYVVWAVDTMCRDVLDVRRALSVRKYPHMSIIWPEPSSDGPQQLAVVEGVKTVDEIMSIMRGCEDRVEALQADAAAREEEYKTQRLLREMQDLEYQETLQMDREREQGRKQKENKEQLKKQKSLEYEAKKQDILESLRQSRTAKAEAWKDKRSELEKSGIVLNTNICLRLPNGKRLEHRFNKDEKICVLYEWVEICQIFHDVCIPPKFNLKTPLGQSAITDLENTFADYDLCPSAVVMLTHVKGILDEMQSEIEAME